MENNGEEQNVPPAIIIADITETTSQNPLTFDSARRESHARPPKDFLLRRAVTGVTRGMSNTMTKILSPRTTQQHHVNVFASTPSASSTGSDEQRKPDTHRVSSPIPWLNRRRTTATSPADRARAARPRDSAAAHSGHSLMRDLSDMDEAQSPIGVSDEEVGATASPRHWSSLKFRKMKQVLRLVRREQEA